ncbi:MAG: DUF924 family protein [Chromatiales bacterium]
MFQYSVTMAVDYRALLDFWFGDSPDDGVVIDQKSALWWTRNEKTDQLIRERFVELRESAIAGRMNQWAKSPAGRLALIILIDQFSRNLFRNEPQAFEHDALARCWCVAGLTLGEDRRLRPIERVFFYLPLEHSELLEDQERSVALYRALCEEVPASQRPAFAGFLEYADRHRDVIQRFDRFPHRNAILSRASTPEEIEFLKQPGPSF